MCKERLYERAWEEIDSKEASELERSHWLIYQMHNTRNSLQRRLKYEKELDDQIEFELCDRLDNGVIIEGMHLIALRLLSDNYAYIIEHEGSC